eukprot:TRINITY_DN5043_c0_g1_i1.p1 TRINITY_DN5043_c0_g1~~TRINITY_DN5043_c0_g1_i1.p1  ORF type:complete len:123 (-),score=7.05 TRINITY_DN5043_c0_g1_i1:63-431(-)
MTQDAEGAVQAFLLNYYQHFDTSPETRSSLFQLYDETAVLRYEGQDLTTKQAIAEKYQGLPFQVCQHKVSKFDFFPLGDDKLLICVFGELLADQDAPFSFTETFITKGPFIFRHNFRLVLHS